MKATDQTKSTNSDGTKTIKQCCARLYESDIAKILLGDSFHPGGLRLTERLGTLLGLTPEMRVLDVASGTGTTAFFLAEHFACQVVGVDYGDRNVERANELAGNKGLASRVHFELGDAERLKFSDASFDAIVCECAFCTFPDKSAAAHQFARVLRPGGRVGISDLTRCTVLPRELDGLLAWISCIADAQPLQSYTQYLRSAGLDAQTIESHDGALAEIVGHVQAKLFGIEIMAGLKKIDLPGLDVTSAMQMAKAALQAVQHGHLGYAIVTAKKPNTSD